MEKFRCQQCERDFNSEESLQQHNRDKHGVAGTQSKHELRSIKKQEIERHEEIEKKKSARSKMIKRSMYAAVPIVIIAIAVAFVSSLPPATDSSTPANPEIPRTPIHWHPTLEIIINGQQQTIPANLGLVGVHQPIHTHDSTGVLHYENDRPTFENMRLGYFFEKVWRRPFNSTCIFNYCNGDSGSVKMFVNGQENFEFENYIPKDKDGISIEFS